MDRENWIVRQYLGYTLLLVEAYEGLAGAGGQVREPEAGAAADAHHGAAGHLPQSPRQPACARAPGLSYLLEKLRVTRPNQAWAADITCLPMARGFLYLVAIMDWHSRYVVAWRLSNSPRSWSRAGNSPAWNSPRYCRNTG